MRVYTKNNIFIDILFINEKTLSKTKMESDKVYLLFLKNWILASHKPITVCPEKNGLVANDIFEKCFTQQIPTTN